MPTSGQDALTLNNFQGTVALVDLTANGDIEITGSGTGANVLGLGLAGPSDAFFTNSSSPAATTEFLNGQTTDVSSGAAGAEIHEQGCCDTTLLNTTINYLRTEQPTLPTPLPNGVTDVRFYRVFVDTALTGIHLKAASGVGVATPAAP